jgi:hypothetical protein
MRQTPFAHRKKTLVYARLIARLITSENQDATIVIVGNKGKGKSWFALALAEAIARELSNIFYNDDTHWKEFWNPPDDTAIIDDDKIIELLQRQTKKHHIKVLDDVGYSKGIDSRGWRSKENKETTSTVSVNRTENGVAIYTSQSHFYIDKKIREIMSHYIEMTGPKHREAGTNMAKLHEMTMHPKDDDPIHYPFFYRTWNDDPENEHTLVHPLIVGGAPSPEITTWYEPARALEAENAIAKKRQNGEQENENNEPDKPVNATVFVKKYKTEHPQSNNDYSAYIDEVHDACMNAGYNVGRALVVTALNNGRKRKTKNNPLIEISNSSINSNTNIKAGADI